MGEKSYKGDSIYEQFLNETYGKPWFGVRGDSSYYTFNLKNSSKYNTWLNSKFGKGKYSNDFNYFRNNNSYKLQYHPKLGVYFTDNNGNSYYGGNRVFNGNVGRNYSINNNNLTINNGSSQNTNDLATAYVNATKQVRTPSFSRTSSLLDLGNNNGWAVNGYESQARDALQKAGVNTVQKLQELIGGVNVDNKFGKNTLNAFNTWWANRNNSQKIDEVKPGTTGANPVNKYDYISEFTNNSQTPGVITALMNGKLKVSDVANNMQYNDELTSLIGNDWQTKYGETIGRRDRKNILQAYKAKLNSDSTNLSNINYLAKDGFTRDELQRLNDSNNPYLKDLTFDEDSEGSGIYKARKTPGTSNLNSILSTVPTNNIGLNFKPIDFGNKINPVNMNNLNMDTTTETLKKEGKLQTVKKGSKIMNKYQEGGGMAPQQGGDDVQAQIIQLVQAAMQGDEQASQQIEQIMQAAQQGDEQAAQLAQLIQEVVQQMQGQAAQAAKKGAKLNYIRRLRGECGPDEELVYFKSGGQICKKCQKKEVKKACKGKKMFRNGGTLLMNDILTELYAKGGRMHTAFGGKVSNPEGRYGGRKAFNPNGTHQLDQHSKPNKFTAFGDEGKKKPTNSGLTGHHATGKAGRMQNKQSAGTTYKATAFGGDKQKRYHKGTGGVPRSGLRTIPGYPKGHGGKSGIGRM